MTPEEKISKAEELKAEGNGFFKQGNYTKALSKYAKIFAYVSGIKAPEGGASMMTSMIAPQNQVKLSDSSASTIDSLLLAASGNMTQCYLNLKDFGNAMKYADKVSVQLMHAQDIIFCANLICIFRVWFLFYPQVLEKDPSNAKGLFRRAKVFSSI